MTTYQHALSNRAVVERSLNDVVSVRVAQQLLKPASVQELANKERTEVRIGDTDTLPSATIRLHAHLLNDVGGKLLHRQGADVANELTNDSLAEAVVVQVKNVLDNVVAEGILNEVERVERDLSHELNSLGCLSVALHDWHSQSAAWSIER